MMHPWPHALWLVLLFSAHGLAQATDPEMDPLPFDGSLPKVLETTYSDGMAWSTDFELLSCHRCGGRREVLAMITEGAAVRAILRCLGLPVDAPVVHPARGPPELF